VSAQASPIRDILHTAIQREIDAYDLYSTAAQKAEIAHARSTLQALAAQEVGHRRRLEGLLEGGAFKSISGAQRKKVVDLKITDYLVEVALAADSDFQDILIVAGKREKASHDLYASLAQVAEDSEAIKLFELLASEELAHKNRIEALYEDIVYRDN
jgi:rubrerythrin